MTSKLESLKMRNREEDKELIYDLECAESNEKQVIPRDVLLEIDNFVDSGHEASSFVMCMLANDIRSALGKATHEQIKNIYAIAQYIFNRIPAACSGSYLKVEAWAHMKQEERELEAKRREHIKLEEEREGKVRNKKDKNIKVKLSEN